MKFTNLSVIIINYNTGHLLQECLKSIHMNIKTDYHVFIVDNNSSDNSWQVVKNFLNCSLIRNKKNVGFCKANNQILKIIKSDFILFLNPDTVLTKDAIDKMMEYLRANIEIGIIGPKVLYPNGKLQYTMFSFPTIWTIFSSALFLDKLFPKSKIFNKKDLGYLDHSKIRLVDAVSGCCLLLKKEVYNEIGRLDEKFFYMDDIDFCYRAKNKGWKIIYFPKSIIYHYGGMSSKGNRYAPAYFSRTSKIKYFHKHGTKKEVFLLKIIFLLEAIFRIPIDYIWYLTCKNIESKTRLKAYFDVLKFILFN